MSQRKARWWEAPSRGWRLEGRGLDINEAQGEKGGGKEGISADLTGANHMDIKDIRVG